MAGLSKSFKLLYGSVHKSQRKGTVKKSNPLKWGANFSRSVMLSAKDVLYDELVPNMVEFDKVNGEIIKEIGSTLRNPGKLRSRLEALTTSGTYLEAKKTMGYLVDDLKSGEFYNPERDRTNMGLETAALMDSFGGEDDYFGDGSSSDSGSGDGGSSSGFNDTIEKMADGRAIGINTTIGYGISAIVKNDQAIHENTIKIGSLNHAQSMAAMANITQTQLATTSSLIDAQLKTMTPLIEATMSIDKKMDTIIDKLTLMTSPPKKDATGSQRRISGYEQVFGDSKMPSLGNYAKMVGKNADAELGISTLISIMTAGMGVKDALEMFKSNPLEGIPKALIRSMMPKMTKKAMSEFNKSLEGFFPSMIMMMNKMGNDDNNSWAKQKVGKILGSRISADTQIRTDGYNIDQSELMQRMGKSVIEVIPTYLADIAAALTGSQKKIYDYKAGKFVDTRETYHRNMRDVHNLDRHMSGSLGNYESRMNMMEMTESEKKLFKKDLREYLKNKAKRGEALDINGSFDPSRHGDIQKQSFEIIKGLTRSMSRSDILAMNKEIITSLIEQARGTERKNKELKDNGLMALFNDYDDNKDLDKRAMANEDMERLDDTHVSRSTKIEKSRGIARTNHILLDIHDTLKRGLVVYPMGGGKGDSDRRRWALATADKSHSELMGRVDARTRSESDRRNREYRDNNDTFASAMAQGRPYASVNSNLSQNELDGYYRRVSEKANDDSERRRQAELNNNDIYRYVSTNQRTKGMMKFFQDASNTLANPFQLVTKTFQVADKALFKMVYGKDSEDFYDEDGNQTHKITSLFEMMATGFNKSIDRLTGWLDEKIFGENSWLRKRMDVGRTWAKEKLYDKGLAIGSNMLGTFKGGAATYQAMMNYNNTYGTKFTSIDDYVQDAKQRGVMDENTKFSAIQRMGFGAGRAKNFVTNKIGSRSDFKNARLYPGLHAMGDKGDLNMMQRAGLEFHNMFNTFSRFMLGDDIIGEDGSVTKTKSKEIFESVAGELKGFMPKAISGAMMGAGAWAGSGLLTGMFLPGGPLLAALMGSTVNLVKHSDKLKEYLFGNEEKGTQGKIDKQVVDGFKKYAPKVAIGTLAGAAWANFGILGGSLMPFGPIGGAILGSAAGMIAASDDLKKMLFGDGKDMDSGLISKNMRQAAKEKGIDFGVGAGLGVAADALLSNFGLFGQLLLPGGPVVAAVLGGFAGVFSTTSLKKYFFGEKDKEGNRMYPGVFDKLFTFTKKEYVDPALNAINEGGKKIGTWFKESIVDEFQSGLFGNKSLMKSFGENMKDAFGNFGTYLKEGVNNVFEKNFGKPLGDIVREEINEPLKKMLGFIFNGLGKVIGGIVASPFKLFGAIGRGVSGHSDVRERYKQKKQWRAGRNDRRAQAWTNTKKFFSNFWANPRMAEFAVKMSGGIGFKGWDHYAKMNNAESAAYAEDAIRNGYETPYEEGNTDFTSHPSSNGYYSVGPDGTTQWTERGSEEDYGDSSRGAYGNDQEAAAVGGWWAKHNANRKIRQQERKAKWDKRREDRHKTRMRNAEEERAHIQNERDRMAKDKEARDSKTNKDNDSVDRDDSTTSMKHTDFVFSSRFKKSILKMGNNIASIRDEVAGQLGGVGFNLAHIKNILASKWGEPHDVPGGTERKDYTANTTWGKIKKFGRRIGRGIGGAKDAVVDKIYDTLDIFFGPNSIAGKVFNGVGHMFGILKSAGGAAKDIIKTVGLGVKEFGVNLAAGIGEGLGSLFASVGNIAEAITLGLKGVSESFGAIVGNIGAMITDGMSTMSGFMATGAQALFGLVRGFGFDMIAGSYKLAKGALKGAGGFLGNRFFDAWDWIQAKREGRKFERKERRFNIGTFKVEGGTIDEVSSVTFKTANGIGRHELELVNVVKGFAVGNKPTRALPVYVLGGSMFTKDPPLSRRDKHAQGKDLDNLMDDAVEKDLDKVIGSMTSAGMDPDKKADLQLALTRRLIEGGAGGTGSGEAKKGSLLPALLGLGGAGLAGLLATLLRNILAPIVGSVLAWTRGDYDRVAMNAVKAIPKLRNGFNGLVSEGFQRFTSPIVKGWKMSAAERMARMGVSASEGALVTAEHAAARGTSERIGARMGFGMMMGKARDWTKDYLNPRNNAFTGGLMLDKTRRATVKGAVKAGVFKPNAKFAAGMAIADAKDGAAMITKRLTETLMNSKFIKAIGGQKMVAGLKAAISAVAKKASGRMTASIVSKFLGGPGMVVFALYDLSTGMAEAKNIFHVSDTTQITWKMRICSGIAKAISGLIFGIIPDDIIAETIYNCISDQEEVSGLKQSQLELKKKAAAYNSANGTNLSLEEYNDKVENKRVFTKVISDPIMGVYNGAKAVLTGKTTESPTASGSIGGLASILSAGFLGLIEHAVTGSIAPGTLSSIMSVLGGSSAMAPTPVLGKGDFSFPINSGIPAAMAANKIPTGSSAKTGTTSTTHPMAHTLDGMTYFKQTEGWGTVGNKYDIGKSGCGPTSAAMVISSYGNKINPKEAAARAQNFVGPDGGTDPKFFANIGAEYGVKFRNGTVNAAAIINELKNNRPVVLMGKKNNSAFIGAGLSERFGYTGTAKTGSRVTPFGTNMHYLVASSYNSGNNKVFILDPEGRKTGYYSLDAMLPDIKNAIFTSSNSGGGIKRNYAKKGGAGASFASSATPGAAGDAFTNSEGIPSEVASSGESSITDIMGLISAIGGFGDKLVAAKYGIQSWAQLFGGGATGMDSVPPASREAILNKLYELTVKNEGAYNSVSNDKNGSSGSVIGPSVGILQWHGGRIANLMSRIGPQLSSDPLTQKYMNYNWGSDKPWSKGDLAAFSAYLTKHKDVVLPAQQSLAKEDINGTNLEAVYQNAVNTGKIKDPRAIAFLADFANTGPAHVKTFMNMYTPAPAGVNEFQHFLSEFKNKSYWGKLPIYQGRISATSAALSNWYAGDYSMAGKTDAAYGGSTWVTGDTDMHQWFGQRLEKLAQAKNQKLTVTSGYRSIAEQEAAVKRNLGKPGNRRSATGGVVDRFGNSIVASPGGSQHQAGLAADVAGWAKKLKNDELAQYGLWKPMGYEDWHIEPIETKNGSGRFTAKSMIAKYGVPVSGAIASGYGTGSGSTSFSSKSNTLDKDVTRVSTTIEAYKNRQASGMGSLKDLTATLNKSIASPSADVNGKMVELMAVMVQTMNVVVEELKGIRQNTADATNANITVNRMQQNNVKSGAPPIPTVEARSVDTGRRNVIDEMIVRRS